MSIRSFRALLRPASRRLRRPTSTKLLRFELLEERATPAGLVAAYGFNENTGGTVVDASGNSNTGSLVNATWNTAGKYGNALSFNGTNALVTVPDANSLDLTTGMTLEAWVNPSVVSGKWRDVIYKGVNDIYYLMATSPSQGRPATGGTYTSNLLSTSNLPVNTWSHLAATYDGATLRLYVNGVQVASRAETDPIATSTGPLTIGGDNLYSSQYFAGRIDEVRIYNRALTAAEIQTDMNTPVGSEDTTPPVVTLTGPADGATVTGAVTVSADAFDNVGVVGVQFLLDGSNLGSEDTVGPYSVSWDTFQAARGTHTLTAHSSRCGRQCHDFHHSDDHRRPAPSHNCSR